MKFPVLWLSFVSVWVGTGKVICLAGSKSVRSKVVLIETKSQFDRGQESARSKSK